MKLLITLSSLIIILMCFICSFHIKFSPFSFKVEGWKEALLICGIVILSLGLYMIGYNNGLNKSIKSNTEINNNSGNKP